MHMKSIKDLQQFFIVNLESYDFPKSPVSLYDPVRYIMNLGGKRIRPVLVLAAYNLYKENVEEAKKI